MIALGGLAPRASATARFMEPDEIKITINQLLSLPRKETRKRPECSLEAALRAMTLATEAGYASGLAYAHLARAEYYLYSVAESRAETGERAARIADNLRRALEGFAQAKDEEGAMLARLAEGAFELERDRVQEAEAALAEAEAAAARRQGAGQTAGQAAGQGAAPGAGARLGEAAAVDILDMRGHARLRQGFLDEAEAFFQGALARSNAGKFGAKAAGALHALGMLAEARGDPDAAARFYERAAARADEEGEARSAAESFRRIAAISLDQADFDRHRRYQELCERRVIEAVEALARDEIRNMKSYYVKENARIISSAERHIEERILERNIKLEEANWQLNTISDIGQKITASLDIDEVLHILYSEICALMNADSFFIATYDERADALDFKIAYEMGMEIEPRKEMARENEPLVRRCLESGGTFVTDGAGGLPAPGAAPGAAAFAAGSLGPAIFTCLKAKGRVTGALAVRSNRGGAYSPQQVKLLESISNYVSIAIENASIYKKLDEISKQVTTLANHDSLTGIPNRRLLFELVPKTYANAMRGNTKVAFLFMDMDNFKFINDNYGHQAGDEVLTIFKDRVLSVIRSTDIFARIGGDEFVVVMTDLKIKFHAAILARKIIREISRPIVIQNEENHIGVSIGISVFPDDSRDTEILLVMADEAMYKIKKDQKNGYRFFNSN
jgi:diguanylate cyclase (GGDEF)-like protein